MKIYLTMLALLFSTSAYAAALPTPKASQASPPSKARPATLPTPTPPPAISDPNAKVDITYGELARIVQGVQTQAAAQCEAPQLRAQLDALTKQAMPKPTAATPKKLPSIKN